MINIYGKIRSSGGRLTKVRKSIIEMLTGKSCCMTKQDIIEKLQRKNITPNRTTIYRELLFLVKSGIVQKNNIAGSEYYEIPQDHHHHLVCLGCNLIEKIKICGHLKKQEKKIAEKNKFDIINHSLEFYGYCRKCRA